MAAPLAPSLPGTGPRRWLSLSAVDLAGGVLAHAGSGSPGDGARLLRRGDPRELGHRSPEPSQSDLRPQDQPPHARSVPYPGHYRGRGPLVACRLQEVAYQAVPQGGEALRTETTINDTRDFGIGRRIENLPKLRRIGFAANRRLLDVESVGHDCLKL